MSYGSNLSEDVDGYYKSETIQFQVFNKNILVISLLSAIIVTNEGHLLFINCSENFKFLRLRMKLQGLTGYPLVFHLSPSGNVYTDILLGTQRRGEVLSDTRQRFNQFCLLRSNHSLP